jgi:hypothetical protein
MCSFGDAERGLWIAGFSFGSAGWWQVTGDAATMLKACHLRIIFSEENLQIPPIHPIVL